MQEKITIEKFFDNSDKHSDCNLHDAIKLRIIILIKSIKRIILSCDLALEEE